MRHGDKINNLSRTASHRKVLLSGLACQLIEHKKIVTTLEHIECDQIDQIIH